MKMGFYEGKNCLVTGASGFVGTHFVQELLAQGAHVRAVVHNRPMVVRNNAIELFKADLTVLDECVAAMEGADCVFHCAGAVASAAVTVANPMEAIISNLLLTARVLQAAWACGTKRALIFSSSTGYPLYDHPVKEEEMFTADPPPVYYGYGWMRRYLELMGKYIADKSKCEVIVARPSAVYGRHDNFSENSSHVIPALIRRAASKENPFVVWGTGNEVRDFLHITDLAKGCLEALSYGPGCSPVNIAYGQGITIREIVAHVLKHTGHDKAGIVFDASKPTTIPVRLMDISKARRQLGFSPSVTFEDGMRDTVSWYMKEINR
jgi:GDP-L-fucose synthase